MFPVLTALGHALVSPRAALVVAPLFATLSLVGLWCVARRLGGVHAAWLAATLTAVSLPQIWFAKLSVPETVAQCFVMAGVLAWLVACARGATRWALAAGWFLGLACFAKVDLLVLLPVFLLAVVAVRLLTRARVGDPPLHLAFLAAFGLLVAHNLVHYLSFASHYRPYVAYLIQTSVVVSLLRESALVQAVVVLAVGLLVAAGVAAFRRPAWRWPRWCWGWAAVAALVAYGVNYVTTTAGRVDETIVWLSWYVSWPVLGLAALGLTGLVPRPAHRRGTGAGRCGPAPRRRRPTVSVRPIGDGPADRIDAAVRAGRPSAHDALRRPNRRHPAGACGGRPISVGRDSGPPVRSSWDSSRGQVSPWSVSRCGTRPSRRPRRWRGCFRTRRSCWRVPIWQAAHIQTSLTYLHDVDAILVQERNPDDQMLRYVIRDWLAHGRAVFLALGPQEFSFFAPDLVLEARDPAQIDLRVLERTRTRAPQAAVSTPIQLQLFQVTRTRGRDQPDIDIRDACRRPPVRPARVPWARARPGSGPRHVPMDRAAGVPHAAGGGGRHARRPRAPARPGTPPAEISVWIGEQLVGERVLGETPQAIRLALPETGDPGPIDLTIQSTVFQPRSLGPSPDPRDLGVRLYRVAVHLPRERPVP